MDDLVRTYMREIGRVPLLTQEQELVYGKQVQQMMYLVQLGANQQTIKEPKPYPYMST